ncbi:hypothetical protein ZYGNAAKF_CDS0188 [Enterococcus phage VRE9_2]
MQTDIFVNGGDYYIIESFPEIKIFIHHQIFNDKLVYEFRKGENKSDFYHLRFKNLSMSNGLIGKLVAKINGKILLKRLEKFNKEN